MKASERFLPILWLAAGLSVAGLLVACAAPAESGQVKSDKERQQAVVPDQETVELVSGNSAFAFDLYQELKESDGNLFYSPYSISLALAMTYAGARDVTEVEMGQAMHYTLPQTQLHPAFNALDTTLTAYGPQEGSEEDDAFTLNIANAIWGQSGFEFLPAYLDLLAENYGAGLRTLDFASDPETATETINGWVSDQTEGKIEDLIPPGMLNSLVRLVLTNAIYFNGPWLSQFEEGATHDDSFTLLDGGTVTVPMMSQTETYFYSEGDGYQSVALPYQGAPVSMLLILPDEGRFEEIETAFSPGLLDEIDGNQGFQSVALTMPKFTFESEFNLSKTLGSMGMANAFSGEADFSGMTGAQDLFISDVVHKAFVAVDEEGTEAAAATAVIMMESAAIVDEPVEMKLDQPFLFLIRDDDTGTILFAGRVLNPEA